MIEFYHLIMVKSKRRSSERGIINQEKKYEQLLRVNNFAFELKMIETD